MIFRSIKTRILWSHIIAILLVNVALGGLTYRFMANKMMATEKKNLEFIVGHMAEMIRHNVLQKQESLQQIGRGREVVDYLTTYRYLALAQYLTGFQREFPQISFVDNKGFEQVRVENGENAEVCARAYGQKVMNRTLASPNSVEIIFDQEVDNSPTSLFYLALSKYNYFGDQYQGTLLATIPYRFLLHEVAATHIHSDGYLALWGDGQEHIFAQESGEGHTHGRDAILRIRAHSAEGQQFLGLIAPTRHFQQLNILGVDSLAVYVPIPELALNLVMTLPHAKIASQLAHLRGQALLVFLALCLLAALLSYLLARTITNPISTLTTVTREIAAGQYDNQGLEGIKDRRDEVGVLVSSFQAMLDRLWSTMVSRDYVDNIFAVMAESVIVVAETGEIKRVNASACRLLGYSEEELLELTITDIFVNTIEVVDFVGGNLTRKKWQEGAYRHKDGSAIAVLFSCSSLARPDGGAETVCVASDISRLKQAREALEENEYYLKALMAALPSGVVVIDAENRIVIDANPAACQLFQADKEQLVGQVCYELFAPVDETSPWPPVVSEEEPIINMECELVPPAAARLPLVMSVQAITLRDSLVYINSFVDITDSKKMLSALKESEEKLRSLAISDELTGILNRRGFMTLVEKQLQICTRNKKTAYLLYADIDNLKEVNDTLGHSVGDRLICQTARIFSDVCRQSDIVGRLGGDEFGVLLTDAESEDAILDRLEARIAATNNDADQAVPLAISIGIVSCSEADHGSPCLFDTMMSLADAKMYSVKHGRKGHNSSS